MRLAEFPRTPCCSVRRRSTRCAAWSDALGGEVEIWAKREDCNSGIALGGNKVRKLEYLVADALAQGCDTLVSIGGIQSNHTRAVTGVARYLGLDVVTVQEHWVDWPDMVYDKVGNLQLTRIMGGDIRIDPAGFDIGIRDSWKQALDSVTERGGRPYAIPAGASDHPLGGLGFANWAVEVAAQEAELRHVLRHGDRVHGHRLQPRRHDRRLRASRTPAATHRNGR
ncbi:MAG: pyridoxal-phosphate dependent enzyme [Ilumatobacteraceae bacterium]